MKINDAVLDPDGRPARIITLPIPGRPTPVVTILYPDGHARLVELAKCRLVLEQQQTAPRSNKIP